MNYGGGKPNHTRYEGFGDRVRSHFTSRALDDEVGGTYVDLTPPFERLVGNGSRLLARSGWDSEVGEDLSLGWGDEGTGDELGGFHELFGDAVLADCAGDG